MSYLLLLLLAAVISSALALYAWLHRRVPGAQPLMWLMIAVVVWSLAYALELAVHDLSAKITWAKIEYLGIAILPVAWLICIAVYGSRSMAVAPPAGRVEHHPLDHGAARLHQ